MNTFDAQNNFWVTDVALHQVFKFEPYGGKTKQPLITIGQRVSGLNQRLKQVTKSIVPFFSSLSLARTTSITANRLQLLLPKMVKAFTWRTATVTRVLLSKFSFGIVIKINFFIFFLKIPLLYQVWLDR